MPKPLPKGQSYLTMGFRQLKQTLRHIRRYKELFKLLIAFLVYNDGIVTVIYFAALYATQTIGFTAVEVGVIFIAMNVVAAAGAFSFGWIADRIGQKRTIFISLTIWIIAVVLAYFIQMATRPVFMSSRRWLASAWDRANRSRAACLLCSHQRRTPQNSLAFLA